MGGGYPCGYPCGDPGMSTLAEQIRSWRGGSKGFFKFLKDVQPRVRSSKGGFVPFEPGPREKAEIEAALDGADHSVIVFCWPRRHGKTVTNSVILTWRFMTRRTENIAVIANSERQVVDTAFRCVREQFEQTPALQNLVKGGSIRVMADRIDFAATGSTIQAFASNPGALWGKKLSCAQISELHAAPKGEEVFAALAGSLLDTDGSVLLVDSTVGPRSSKLYELYQQATGADPDKSIYFSHICYANLEEACAECPPWISATKLRSLSRQMLPTDFNLYHLNRWGDATSALFSKEIIAQCIDDYPLDPKAITAGAAFVVAGGLDRAFGMSKHGDATFTSAVLKTTIDEDEHIYVLASDYVMLSRSAGIRANLTRYHRDFGMSHFLGESYNSQDIGDWASGQPWGENASLIQPSRQSKYHAFSALYRAAAEGRLHIHPSFKRLLSEMEGFEVHADGKGQSDGQASIPKFTHQKGGHDDALHALAWALHAVSRVELSAYELPGINCVGREPNISHCALNGGGFIPACGESCRSMLAAHSIYQAYSNRSPSNPLSFEEFIDKKLKNTGAHTFPR